MTISARPAGHAAGWALCALAALGGCSPTFNWRDVTPQGTGMTLTFPCSPDRLSRTVRLAQQQVQMEMLACSTGGATFAVSAIELAHAEDVPAQLDRLRSSAVANVLGDAPRLRPWALPGATPTPAMGRLETHGRLPDGRTVVEHAVFFARGTMLFQVSVVAAEPSEEVVDTFFGSLKWAP